MLLWRIAQAWWELSVFWRCGWTKGVALLIAEPYRVLYAIPLAFSALAFLVALFVPRRHNLDLMIFGIVVTFTILCSYVGVMVTLRMSSEANTGGPTLASTPTGLLGGLNAFIVEVFFPVYVRYGLLAEAIASPFMGLLGVALFVCLAFFCLSPLVLLAGVWSVIYYELSWTFRSRQWKLRARSLAHAARLKTLAESQLGTDADQKPSRSYFDSVSSRSWRGDRAGLVLASMEHLKLPWIRLLECDNNQLSVSCYALLDLATETRLAVADELTRTMEDFYSSAGLDLARRTISYKAPPTQCVTLNSAIHELAGIVVAFLPFPRLKHLARPWRTRAFLPFLLTIPGLRLIPSRPTEAESSPPPPDELSTFLKALQSAGTTAMAMGLRPVDFALIFRAYLELEPAQSRAVKAEYFSHQAILDAVLDWKAQKLEFARTV
ncbi:hypothetical protein JCM10207_002833 [Rhodosporidiobolus poonsookiae]